MFVYKLISSPFIQSCLIDWKWNNLILYSAQFLFGERGREKEGKQHISTREKYILTSLNFLSRSSLFFASPARIKHFSGIMPSHPLSFHILQINSLKSYLKKKSIWWESSDFSHWKFAFEELWINSNYFTLILTRVKNIPFNAESV